MNIKKSAIKKKVAQPKTKAADMAPHMKTLSRSHSSTRRKPGTGPDAGFYRIEVRPSRSFTSFRTQDVGKKGGLERIAGHRASGSWDTQAWLVSKRHAHVNEKDELVIDNIKERKSLEKAISGKIILVEGGLFHAHPAKNIPEAAKPTPAMKRAQAANIKKAQAARNKKI